MKRINVCMCVCLCVHLCLQVHMQVSTLGNEGQRTTVGVLLKFHLLCFKIRSLTGLELNKKAGQLDTKS